MTFKRKSDGFARAKRFHLCTACLHFQPQTFKECPNCAVNDMRQFFTSKVEMMRGCELIRKQVSGEISNLKFQPRYDLIVDGVKICAYQADSEYRENGKQIVEDVKPFGNFMDDLAEVKIRLFTALYRKHGVEMRIHRKK